MKRLISGRWNPDKGRAYRTVSVRHFLAYFSRWLVLHGYLDRTTNLMEGVQRYSKKVGTIQIFTPDEISVLLKNADGELALFIMIGAFAGLRGAETQRLDWSEIDLQENFLEVKAENSKTEVRRPVPIKPNLAAWLKPHQKKAGPVCPLNRLPNYLIRLVDSINKDVPKNAPDSDGHWPR